MLSDACRAAAAGTGGVVLVAGEPGIGKTTLVEEALLRSGVRPAWGTCSVAPGAPPYWPWRQVLRSCGALPTTEAGHDRAATPLHGARGDEASRFALFEGVLDVLRATARGGALAVVLDDLQWADEASLALLSWVAASARREALLLIGLYRDTEVLEPLARAVELVASHGTVLELEGLAPAEVSELLLSLPAASDAWLGDPARSQRLHRLTGGNPFFVREVAALAGAGGGVEGELAAGMRLPGGVRAVVGRRLARLSHEAQDLLVWAALDGGTMEVAELAAVTGRDPAEVLAALDEATTARLAEPTGTARYAFTHDLVREVLAASLGEATRAGRHWVLGTAMARTSVDGEARLARVAGHLVAGVAAGDADVAVGWAVKAAEAASSVLAHEEAASWYHQALQIRRPLRDGDDAELELLLRLGRARFDAGQLVAARDAFVAAASSARRRRDPVRLAEAALGLGAGLAGFEVQLFDQAQIELLEEALAALGDEETPLRAMVLSRLSVALAFVEPSPRRAEMAERAITIARATRDGATLASALAAWCDACAGPDHVHDRLRAAREIVSSALGARNRPLELLGRRLQMVALLELGRLGEARDEIGRYARIADHLRQPLYRWYVPLWRAALAMAEGDVASSERWTAEALRIGALAESGNAAVLTTVQRWVRLRHEQRLDEAAALQARFLDEAPQVHAPEALDEARLICETARGAVDAAMVVADRLATRDWSAPRADSEWLANAVLVAEAATVIGHRPLAEVLHRALLPYAEQFAVEGIGAAVTGSVAHYLALTADLLGDGDAESFRRLAERLHRQAGMTAPPPPISGTRPAEPPGGPTPRAASLHRAGPVWIATYAGASAHLADTKGLRDIAALLRAPGRPVHVTELTGAPVGTTAADLDRTAVAAYRRRLLELDAELADAEDDHDEGRAARTRIERDALIHELSSAVGLGGRARRSGDPVERARKAVTARIRDCIRRTRSAHPQLGRHLGSAVRTGTWCCYEPEDPIDWHID